MYTFHSGFDYAWSQPESDHQQAFINRPFQGELPKHEDQSNSPAGYTSMQVYRKYYQLLLKKDELSALDVHCFARGLWQNVIKKYEVEMYMLKKAKNLRFELNTKPFRRSKLGSDYERNASWKAFKMFYRIFDDKTLTAEAVKSKAAEALQRIILQHKAEVTCNRRIERAIIYENWDKSSKTKPIC